MKIDDTAYFICAVFVYVANLGHVYSTSLIKRTIATQVIPLIRKDGDDVINKVTCALTGTGSISVHRVYMGNMALNRIKRLKSSTKIGLTI